MMRLMLTSLLSLFVATSANSADVRLKQVPRENGQGKTTVSTTVNQTLTIAGMDVVTAATSEMVMSFKSGKRNADGKLAVESRIESMLVTQEVQGQTYNFDSTNPDQKGTSPFEFLRDLHKAAVGQVTTTIYGKDNRVVDVTFDKNITKDLPDQAKDLVKDLFDPEYLKQTGNQELDRLPSQAVSKGDTWTRTQVVGFGAGQTMTFQVQYTYDGVVDRNGKQLDKITSKSLSVDFKIENPNLPLKLKSSKLTPSGKTELFFDRSQGAIVLAIADGRVTGDLVFEANGMELPSKLDLKMASKTKTTRLSGK